MSSLNSFVVGVLAARECGAVGFGIFATAWVTFGVGLAVSRGLGTDPLTVRYSGCPSPAVWQWAASSALAIALLSGLGFGAICVVGGLLVGGALGQAVVALGLVLPGLLVQDAWRFVYLAAGASRKAFVNDVVWCVALVPLLVLAVRAGTADAFVLAWGIGALVAATAGMVQSGFGPQPRAVAGWLREHRALGARYLGENVMQAGHVQLLNYGIAAIVGLAAVGSLRGVAQLFGPLVAVLTGLAMVGVAEGVRILGTRPSRLRPYCVLSGLGRAALVVCWGAALMVAPDGAGRAVLGSLWDSAEPLILPAMVAMAAGQLAGSAHLGLRALGAARRSLRAQSLTAALALGAGLCGARLGGVVGAAWAAVGAYAIAAVVCWWELEAELRTREVPLAQTPGTEAPRTVSA